MARFRKSDIRMRDGSPCVNVKVHFPRSFYDGTLAREVEADSGEEGFAAWWETHRDEPEFDWFDEACASELETFTEWENSGDLEYEPVFPDYSGRLKFYRDGRQGGWLVVEGLPDPETWDAIMVARWGKFARVARSFADGVPYSMLMLVAINPYAAMREARDERAQLAETIAADAMAALVHA